MDTEEKYPSPTGKYLFRIYPWEARNSLWVETPALIEKVSEKSLLRFRNSNWSLDEAVWTTPSTVMLRLRKFPGDHRPPSFDVTVDCEHAQAQIDGSPEFPWKELEERLERLLVAH